MAQLWKVRLPDGRTLTPGDWTSAEPLYSTVEIGEGSFPVLTAFSYGRGGFVSGSVGPRAATLRDTNLEGEGARLPENEELIAYSLSIEAFQIGEPDADALPPPDAPDVSLLNMLRLQRDLLCITRIAYVKEYTRAPIGIFPASTGVYQYNSGARSVLSDGKEGYVASNNGSPNVAGVRPFASPLYVAGGESIAVDFRPGPGQVVDLQCASSPNNLNGRIRLCVYFEGYRRRPVA
jgi:hypothetical protein